MKNAAIKFIYPRGFTARRASGRILIVQPEGAENLGTATICGWPAAAHYTGIRANGWLSPAFRLEMIASHCRDAPRALVTIALMFLYFIALGLTTHAQEGVTPLPRAHAHNDYRHARPLLDALDHGFCSVEADIFLVDGELLVAHNLEDVTPERTLRALYLEPLRERVEANHGSVYPNANSDADSVEGHGDGQDAETSAYEFTLLIDIKSDGVGTYAALRDELEEYRNMLTECRNGAVQRGAVTVILSGARPRAVIESEPVRLCAIDGRLGDLDGNAPASLIPLVSQNWRDVFKWRGRGPMPEDEREKLRAYADLAHEQGRRLRFWATPARESLWREQLDAGVDLINTDHLARLQSFLLAN